MNAQDPRKEHLEMLFTLRYHSAGSVRFSEAAKTSQPSSGYRACHFDVGDLSQSLSPSIMKSSRPHKNRNFLTCQHEESK